MTAQAAQRHIKMEHETRPASMNPIRFRLLVCAACFIAASGFASVRAGPVQTSRIFDNMDAGITCPRACGGAGWTGHWQPIDMGHSVCFCNDAQQAAPAPAASASGAGAACSAPASTYCGGCSVACPAGQQASCTQGTPLNDNQPGCWTQAKCECR